MASTPTTTLPSADMLYEVVGGTIVEKKPMGAFEIRIAAVLVATIEAFAKQNKLGRAVTEMLFDLTAALGHKRRPDVAFVSYDRWPQSRQVPRTEAWGVIPDLAVEIISPTNPADDIVDRVAEYFQAGVSMVWIVFPSQYQVYVYDSPTSVRVVARDNKVVGDPVLPGFQLPLADLFEESRTARPESKTAS